MNIEKFLRPSSLRAVSLCEGRALLEAHVVGLDGEPKSSSVADLGTDLHSRIQVGIESVKSGATWDDAIERACLLAQEEGVDSWSIYCIRFSLQTAKELIAKHSIDLENVLTEQVIEMSSMGFTKGGTADLVLLVPYKLAIVVDWKLGFADQGDAEDHDQLAIYGSAAAEAYKVSQVIVVLCQPRAEKENRITQASFDADTLRKNAAWTRSVINLARAENPTLTAGYEQCKFCRALHRCPEVRKKIMDAQEALAVIGHPLDNDGFGELADVAKLADKFAEAGKDLAKQRLESGGGCTGWKLGNPRAIRTVMNVPAAIQKLEAAGYGTEVMDAVSLSFSKLTPVAAALIADQVSEKLSSPPLTQEKGRK